MNLIYKALAIYALLLPVSYSYAQTDTLKNDTLKATTPKADTLEEESKSFLKIGVSYLNNSVYLGRPDTVTTPVITPKISYTFKSGIYLLGALDYITNRKNNPIDNGSVEAGYTHSFTDNLEFGASFTKLFYSNASTRVSSSISGILNTYVDYTIANIITPSISISYNFNKGGYGNDLILNPSVSHDFEIESLFGDDDKLTITPQAGLNAGSQNYYAAYLVKKGRLTKKGTAAATAAVNAYNTSLAEFKLLDYEVSMPVEYKTGCFIFNFTPTYAFAQNSLPQNTAAEKLITQNVERSAPYKPSIFYFEVGLTLKF